MRRTDRSSVHRSFPPARVVTTGSVRPSSAGANSMDGVRLSHGPSLQAGYDFGRIPIFSMGQESRRSMPVVTTPTDRVERDAERMARDVLHRPTGVSPQREGQGRGEMATTSDLLMPMTSGQPLPPPRACFLNHVSVSISVACAFFPTPARRARRHPSTRRPSRPVIESSLITDPMLRRPQRDGLCWPMS